jgi:endonuclease/exonuclease/phosphatase family metal-dependent hydrolase
MMKKLRLLWLLPLLALLYVVGVIGYGTLTDYQPTGASPAEVGAHASEKIVKDSVLSLLSWNLGYAGLGAEADFFYQGSGFFTSRGRMVRPPKTLVDQYFEGTTNAIKNYRADFYLFQEVDHASKRSYFRNQFKAIQQKAPGFFAGYFPNYRAKRVPLPLLEPWNAYGAVNSGLGTYSKVAPTEAKRLQMPGKFGWPKRLFMLDRCLGFTRYKTSFGKDLIVINIHNEAFDKGGIKQQQERFLRELALREYAKGNYVIAGGDWNTCPPFFAPDKFMPGKAPAGEEGQNMNPDLFPVDWNWIYDPTVPTNRNNDRPYRQFKTFVTLIDYYLVSPNVKVRKVKGIKQEFRFSDHQAVWMEVELIAP